jgi:ankyrin repeat protein
MLMEPCRSEAKLTAACWLHDGATVASFRAQHPDIAENLSEADRTESAHAARNNDTQAVLLMLEAGLPVSAGGQHRGAPLHCAAWHGNLNLVRALLRSNIPLEDSENDFHATPMGWTTHG